MNPRTLIDRLLSPAGFGFVLLLFLLPFLTVSCGVNPGEASANVEQSFSFTGVDLLVGGAPDITGPPAGPTAIPKRLRTTTTR